MSARTRCHPANAHPRSRRRPHRRARRFPRRTGSRVRRAPRTPARGWHRRLRNRCRIGRRAPPWWRLRRRHSATARGAADGSPRWPRSTLAPDVRRCLVIPPPEIARMAQDPFLRPLAELAFSDELRADPPRDPRNDPRWWRFERRRVQLARREQHAQPVELATVEARADLAAVPQHTGVVHADEKRSEVAGAVALARLPASDDELLSHAGLRLPPRR